MRRAAEAQREDASQALAASEAARVDAAAQLQEAQAAAGQERAAAQVEIRHWCMLTQDGAAGGQVHDAVRRGMSESRNCAQRTSSSKPCS